MSRALERIGLSPHLLHPAHLAAFALAATSIGSLLAYFSGLIGMPWAVRFLLLPALVLLPLLTLWASKRGHHDLVRRVLAGLWAGSFATLAYDVVRVPLVHAGLPVFKAISYFGAIILAVPHPTTASEIVGWTYHFSNGIGFAIMYMLLVRRPGPWSAMLWGVTLEGVMLVTPYAEVFGYRISGPFLAITIGAHLFYGIGLWLAARYLWRRWYPQEPGPAAGRPLRPGLIAAAWLVGPVVLGLIAADFHSQHARTIPASPPPYIGPSLYVTWSTPEPDRIGAIWLMQREVDPRARFHFIEPMSHAGFGTPFDLPEAEIRRYHNRSTFEVLLERTDLEDDPAMLRLARMCYLTEIRPWALASEPEALALAAEISELLVDCEEVPACLDRGTEWFERTYQRLAKESR